jgi:hypothetical protein
MIPVVTLALALSACGASTSKPSSSGTSSPTTQPAPATTATAVAPTTTTAATTTTTSTVPAPTTTQPTTSTTAGLSSCTTSQLAGSLSNPNGAAGSTFYSLNLLNQSNKACTLYGFPGVSFVAGNAGTQVGAAAVRDHTNSEQTVLLDPNHAAVSTLDATDVYNYPPSTCMVRAVRGFRVYPPGERAALFIPARGLHSCHNPTLRVLGVTAVQPGPAAGGVAG